MTAHAPVSGTFPHFAARWVDPALGFAIGWNYFYVSIWECIKWLLCLMAACIVKCHHCSSRSHCRTDSFDVLGPKCASPVSGAFESTLIFSFAFLGRPCVDLHRRDCCRHVSDQHLRCTMVRRIWIYLLYHKEYVQICFVTQLTPSMLTVYLQFP